MGRTTIGRRIISRTAVLGLVLAVGMASGAAAAADSPGPVGGGVLPPTMPLEECTQRCFDNYAENMGQCHTLFCSEWLFFTFCDNDELAQCKANAQAVFDACLAHCGFAA
ncbi:MAG: hypothetical protein ACYTCU_06005 [Planctomycetota bacterium]